MISILKVELLYYSWS